MIVPEDWRAFLSLSGTRIEDVKGWWGPKHKTYPKIEAFRAQYPELQFEIVVREGAR